MPQPEPQPVKPIHIAIACLLAVAIMFAGSIFVGVAVVKAERAMPAPETPSDASQ